MEAQSSAPGDDLERSKAPAVRPYAILARNARTAPYSVTARASRCNSFAGGWATIIDHL